MTTSNAPQTYEILDPGMRYVGANRLRPGQKSITCTPAEAKFYVEGGALRPAAQEPSTPRQISAAKPTPAPVEPERDETEATQVAGDPSAVVSQTRRAPSQKAR